MNLKGSLFDDLQEFCNFLGGNVTLIVPCVNGGYVISKDRSLCHLDWETETVTTLHTVEDEKDNRFNDGKCDRNGRLWAGN